MEEISRVARPKEKARASYDKLSRWYDIVVGRMEKRPRDLGLAKLDAHEGEKVLEIGFGTGNCLLPLARSVGDSGKVYGLDMSAGMLGVTVGKLEKAGLSKRVELQLGDAVNLPYPDGSFDAIFMSFVLELFDTPEIPLVLRQCRRALKAGGRICIVAMSKGKSPTMLAMAYEWAHRMFPNYIDCRPIYVREAVENAGFKIADVTRVSLWGLSAEIVFANKLETST
ncbi:MAG: methyltransferase domain-containing protein [Chloroflexi bacterium]|nr:methyltransferase domain-containing protein [Chloroflexota bacterium]